MRYLTVRFENNQKEYHYKTYFADIREGDNVVVETQYGLAVAKVSGIKEHSDKATAWIVDYVDLERHKKDVEAESLRQHYLLQMKEREAEINTIKHFEELAEDDEEMKALLLEYSKVR